MKIKRTVYACLLAAALLSVFLWGCGKNQKTENSPGMTAPGQKDRNGQEEALKETEEAQEADETQEPPWLEDMSAPEDAFCFSADDKIAGLNPITNASAADNQAFQMICDPLVRDVCDSGNTSKIIPAAAKRWNVSKDGTTYTFRLRKSARWNDGKRLTAHDFAYTFRLMADPDSGAVNAWLFDGIIENFSDALHDTGGKKAADIKVTAVNNRTLKIKLAYPCPYFLELLANVYPVRQDKYEEWGADYGSSADKIICSGPFEVSSWKQETELVVTKNETYWDAENIKLSKIIQRVIPEPSEAVQAFIHGKLHVVSTSDPELTKEIKKADMSRVRVVPDGAPEFLMFHLKNEFLSNMKVRQALSASLPRQELADALPGGGVPLYSAVPDTMMIGDYKYSGLVKGRNRFAADLLEEGKDPKSLLEEGLKELGKPADTSAVTLRFASRGTDELSDTLAGIYKETWERVLGIHVEIYRMEWDEMWEKVDSGDYDIAAGGWSPYYNEPGAILNLFDPKNGYFNAAKTGWDNRAARKFRKLCVLAADAKNEKEKASAYFKMERLLVKGAVIAPAYLEQDLTFLARTVKNYHVSSNGFPNWAEAELTEE